MRTYSQLIYLPGNGADAERLRAVGLGELLDAESPSFFHVDCGPDGGPGTGVYWGRDVPELKDYRFEAAKQGREEGNKAVAGSEGAGGRLPLGRFWMACPFERPYRPEELARKTLQLGIDVTMADGQLWRVATARQLPQLLGLDDDGEWTGVVVPQYRRFYDAAWSAVEWLMPNEDHLCRVDAQVGADFAALALSINYRLNRDLIAFLGLLTSENMFSIARAAVEFESIFAAQKKTAADIATPNSPGGAPA